MSRSEGADKELSNSRFYVLPKQVPFPDLLASIQNALEIRTLRPDNNADANEHLAPRRSEDLLSGTEPLTPAELRHVKTCRFCNTWLTAFVEIMRQTGRTTTLQLPPL